MSKTTTPPSKEYLNQIGIRFVPANSYAPNHYLVKNIIFSFAAFDTYEEGVARREATLLNSFAECYNNNKRMGTSIDDDRKECLMLFRATLRMLGSNSDQSKF